MKKLKLFTLALLATLSMGAWAATPAVETYDWGQDDFENVIKTYDGITLSTGLTAFGGNLSGKYYIKLDGSDGIGGAYLRIAATQKIDSVAVFYIGNSTSSAAIAWAGWEKDVTPTAEVGTNYGYTDSYKYTAKNYDNVIWKTIDISDKDIYTLQMFRQGKNLTNDGKKISNFGTNQTILILGLRVYVSGGSTPTPECTTPTTDATFVAAATEIAIAADATSATTTLTFTKGSNTSDAEYTILKGGKATEDATIAAGVFTATEAGTYTVKATQAYDNTYCEVTKEVTITVTDNRPKPVDYFTLSTSAPTASSDVKLANGGEQLDLADYSTITGGSAKMQNDHASNSQTVVKKNGGGLNFGAGTVTLIITLDQALQDGDIITATGLTSEGLAFGVEMNRDANLANQLASDDDKFEVPASFEGKTVLYAWRHSGSSTVVKTITITRPADDGTAKLSASVESVDLNVTAENPEVTAKVTFSGKNLTAGTYSFALADIAGLTIDPVTVTVGTDGKLNQEVTLKYTSTTDVAAATAQLVLTIGEKTINVVINYSATLAKNYLLKSFNIEQLVLDNGTGYDIKAVLDAANIEYANINALDSLNDEKTARNEPYLGLKVKTSGGYLKMLVKSGDVLRVKFGFIDKPLKVISNGTETELTAADAGEGYQLTATEDTYITFQTTSGNTVVFKQIMLNEAIAAVTLPEQIRYKITCETAENGSVAATEEGGEAGKAKFADKGTTVTLVVTPDSGYKVESVKVNGEAIEPVESVYSFTMPAENVTVAATFTLDVNTALDDMSSSVKAKKLLQNGAIYIINDGKRYNLLGTEIK